MILYPRLSLPRAKSIAEGFGDRAASDYPAWTADRLSSAVYAPTGGSRVSADRLVEIRAGLRRCATEFGFPAAPTTSKKGGFDRAAAIFLAQAAIPEGEALRAEMWSWIAVQLVPELVAWRFSRDGGGVSVERFAGALVRNAIGRLWLRGVTFDEGSDSLDRWGLVNAMSEDASVGILERPSLSADRRLARAICRSWIITGKVDEGSGEALLREAVKKIRVAAVISEMAALDDEQLDQYIGRIFASCVTT